MTAPLNNSALLIERERVLERCRALGFALAGICAAARSDHERELRDWLAAGKHGEMDYLSRHEELLIDPNGVLPGAKSIICVADRYHNGTREAQPPATFGRIARYARGGDYHKVMKRRLRGLADDLSERWPGHAFRACVDTAPLLEREHAKRAGLGAVGKHTLLIQQGIGSWLLLGEILTTMELPPSEFDSTHAPPADPCGSCTRCIDACPTDAITPWSVDATKCISYLTIERRTPIERRFHEPMANWIFGCDICQEVCPHNQPTRRSRRAPVHAAYAERRNGFDLLEVLNWDEAARREVFVTSSMKRAKLSMMKRNALIAAGNALRTQDEPALRQRIEAIANDVNEAALVRETAKAVLAPPPTN